MKGKKIWISSSAELELWNDTICPETVQQIILWMAKDSWLLEIPIRVGPELEPLNANPLSEFIVSHANCDLPVRFSRERSSSMTFSTILIQFLIVFMEKLNEWMNYYLIEDWNRRKINGMFYFLCRSFHPIRTIFLSLILFESFRFEFVSRHDNNDLFINYKLRQWNF